MAVTIDRLIRDLTQYGLLAAEEAAAIQATLQSADAEQFLRGLVKQQKVSVYQAQLLFAGKAHELVVGNYLILDKLGQGGMGMVLKAEHRRIKRAVALKVLSPTVTKTKEAVQRFHREAQAAARLSHPNIVAAFDASEANGVHYLVTEFVDGRDLSSLVKQQGRLTVDQALDVVRQTAEGLDYAHQQGVIHRDIKPGNLLLSTEGVVKILDMGLARLAGNANETASGADLTSTGTVMGTVDYMSPEQALNTKLADQRADVYALGCTFYYLLTAQSIYAGSTLMEKLIAHREQPIPSLRQEIPQVPLWLEDFFRRMVAKKPDQRFQRMSEVLEAIHAGKSGSYTSQPVELPHVAVAQPSDDMQNFLSAIASHQATTRGDSSSGFSRGSASGSKGQGPDSSTAAGGQTVARVNSQIDTDPISLTSQLRDIIEPASAPDSRRVTSESRSRGKLPVAAIAVGCIAGLVLLTGLLVSITRDKNGYVLLSTKQIDLSGTQIALDGNPLAQLDVEVLPLKLPIPADGRPHELTFAHEGFQELRKTVQSQSGVSQAMTIQMQPVAPPISSGLDFNPAAFYGKKPDVPKPAKAPRSQPNFEKHYEVAHHVVGDLRGSVVIRVTDKKGSEMTVKSLEKLPLGKFQIKSISLRDNTAVRNSRIQFLQDFDSLYALNLEVARLSEAQLENIAQFPRLNQLQLANCELTPEQWQIVCRMNWLQTLDLRSTTVSPEVGAELVSHLPDTQILGLPPGVSRKPATGSPGQSYAALEFDGLSSYVEIPKFSYELWAPITIEAWVLPDLALGRSMIVAGRQRHSWLGLYSDDPWRYGGLVCLTQGEMAFAQHQLPDQPDEPQWVHLAVSCEGHREFHTFCNGKTNTSGFGAAPESQWGVDASIPMTSPPEFTIGMVRLATVPARTHFFRGLIRQVRISRVARYEKEFTPQKELPSDADTLVLYGTDIGGDGRLIDRSGHNAHGQLNKVRKIQHTTKSPSN